MESNKVLIQPLELKFRQLFAWLEDEKEKNEGLLGRIAELEGECLDLRGTIDDAEFVESG